MTLPVNQQWMLVRKERTYTIIARSWTFVGQVGYHCEAAAAKS